MLRGLNVCEPEEEEKCKRQFGRRIKWACDHCEKKKKREIHPWTNHLLYLRRLQKAGYPFGKNDLSFEEWMHLGLVNEMIDKR